MQDCETCSTGPIIPPFLVGLSHCIFTEAHSDPQISGRGRGEGGGGMGGN